MDRDGEKDVREPLRGLSWTTIALIGGLVLLVLIIAYFASRGNSNQDKLTNPQVATRNSANPEKLCSSSATYDLIKRELFRRAAQLRGTDQASYDRLSAAAVVRMENPVMESQESSTGAVNCSGSLSLDLPPGVAAVGGKTTLASDVDYTIQPAADGSGNVLLLRNADSIIAPLATLSRTEQAPPANDKEVGANESSNEDQAAPDQHESAPAVPEPAPQTNSASNPSLAALDRSLNAEYEQALAVASPEQRALLQQTARRFTAYRDRCPDSRCVTSAYVGRHREIRDIIEDRWQPPQ